MPAIAPLGARKPPSAEAGTPRSSAPEAAAGCCLGSSASGLKEGLGSAPARSGWAWSSFPAARDLPGMNKAEMADEALFLLLHNEMVSGLYRAAEQGDGENGRCISKLENMGFRVGQGLIERFTKDTARFKDELDIMKFICKDFWTTVFKKQIDNLRTNHQGIYVLQDNKFRLLTQMSAGKQYLEHAPKYLAFTCGLIRGALSNLGIKSIVTAEVSTMPACKFQVMIQKI
ncbi:trafficking protein particle complex subunit 6B [Podarcis muralis]